MQFEDLNQFIANEFPEAVLSVEESSTPKSIQVAPEMLLEVCELLHRNEKTYFDSLSCLTGMDNGPEANTMEVIYHLYSIPHDIHLALKVVLEREKPEIESVESIWKAADWHEREAFDLLGIHFKNHPDLRRILLPADWEGHPLRKDYEEPEFYHDIKVKY